MAVNGQPFAGHHEPPPATVKRIVTPTAMAAGLVLHAAPALIQCVVGEGDDTRAIYDQAIAAGWKFHAPPINRRLGGTNIPDMWITMTRDPDNVPFEFVERPRSAFR